MLIGWVEQERVTIEGSGWDSNKAAMQVPQERPTRRPCNNVVCIADCIWVSRYVLRAETAVQRQHVNTCYCDTPVRRQLLQTSQKAPKAGLHEQRLTYVEYEG